MPRSGSETLQKLATSPPATLTSGPSKPSAPTICEAMTNAISSLVSAAGLSPSGLPAGLPTNEELVEALADNLRKSLVMPDATPDKVIYSKPGKGGGTFAHPILALAYAEYLSEQISSINEYSNATHEGFTIT